MKELYEEENKKDEEEDKKDEKDLGESNQDKDEIGPAGEPPFQRRKVTNGNVPLTRSMVIPFQNSGNRNLLIDPLQSILPKLSEGQQIRGFVDKEKGFIFYFSDYTVNQGEYAGEEYQAMQPADCDNLMSAIINQL